VNICRLVVGYQQKYAWVHGTGKWRPAASEADIEFDRREHVCSELERIDGLRYAIEDDWNATHSSAEPSQNDTRKRKRTPDDVTQAMRNAKRRLVQQGAVTEEQKEIEASDIILNDAGASEVVTGQSSQQAKEELSGSPQQTAEHDTPNERLCEASTVRLDSRSEEIEQSAAGRQRQNSDSPEIANSFESGKSYDLPTHNISHTTTGMDSTKVERIRNASDSISIPSGEEDVALETNKICIDLMAVDDTSHNEKVMTKSKGVYEALQHNMSPSGSACSAQAISVKNLCISINLYCGDNFQFLSMRMKRGARFETLTSVLCEQEQIPRREATLLWNGKRLDLWATPESYSMGEKEDIHLYHELAGPFKAYLWYNRLTSEHQSVREQQQGSWEGMDSKDDHQSHIITDNASPNAETPTNLGIGRMPPM
jgi:hypothetical protein